MNITKYPSQVVEFVKYVKRECKKRGIKVELRKVKYLRLSGNIHCAGYFDCEMKKLVVAAGHPLWLETFVHEYCHFTQWVEQCPEWVNMGDGLDEIDRWLGGEEVENIEKHISAVRDMELDNEKRSADTISKWGLPIDLETYIKRSNAYVYFYNWIKQTRSWSKPGNSPYSNENVIKAMPSTFDNDYNFLPKNIEKVFELEKI